MVRANDFRIIAQKPLAKARRELSDAIESGLQMNSESEPVARSTLGATPLLHVLVSLLAREATGTLVIIPPDGEQSTLYIDGGIPTKIRTSEPVGRLSELLVSLGQLDSRTAVVTYDEARSNQGLHGQHLVDRQLVDEETLLQTLRAQLALKLGWAAGLAPDTAIDLYENVDFLSNWPKGPAFDSPLEAIWAMARNHVDLKSVASVLRQLVNRPLRLHPLSQPKWFGFNTNEYRVIECLVDGTVDMQSLIQQVPVPVRVVQVMLYVLTIARHLDLGQRKPPIGFALSGSGQRRRVDVSWTSADARASRDKAEGPFSARAPATIPPQPHEQNKAYHSLQALHSMQRAEYFLERHKMLEAEAEAKLAIEHDPTMVECRALYAWIQACRLGEGADLPKILEIMTEALEQNPVDETLRFRRARLLSRLGNVDEAMRDFRLIVELNPRHIDAQREIRLWELRHGRKRSLSGEFTRPVGTRASERPPPPGLFGRIFKKS
jgi:tetratricopeptide (TPR) repeat protein